MKEQYENLILTVTVFDKEDVIATSSVDKNNAYTSLSELDDNSSSSAVLPPSI